MAEGVTTGRLAHSRLAGRLFDGLRQHRDPVLGPLAIAHRLHAFVRLLSAQKRNVEYPLSLGHVQW